MFPGLQHLMARTLPLTHVWPVWKYAHLCTNGCYWRDPASCHGPVCDNSHHLPDQAEPAGLQLSQGPKGPEALCAGVWKEIHFSLG